MKFQTAANIVARNIDVGDNIAAAQLEALSSPEIRRIADNLNSAYLHFYSKLPDEECPRAYDSLTVDPSQSTWAVSPNIDPLRITDFVDMTQPTMQRWLIGEEYEKLLLTTQLIQQTGQPQYYYFLGGRVGFAPLQDRTYKFVIIGGRAAVRLSKALDDFLCPEEYSDCVTDYATGFLKAYHQDPDSKLYIDRATDRFNELLALASAKGKQLFMRPPPTYNPVRRYPYGPV